MQSTIKRSIPAIIAGSAILGSVVFAAPAFAAGPGFGFGFGHMGMHRPGVVGTVASVSGDTITVDAKTWQRGDTSGAAPTTATTTYTVDGTNATVTKDGAASTLSAIAVGDMVMVQGTVSGTSVTATKINDGFKGGMRGGPPGAPHAGAGAVIQGNGSPVIGGSVTAISGNTLTVTPKTGSAYSVDASSATVVKDNATSTLSAIATGDNVIVQGTVNGSSVVASSVIDQGTAALPQTGTGGTPPPRRGFFGGLLSRIFGFF